MDLTLAICVYNAERYIEETLKCVLAQTAQDFHLLIVDDCSSDKSVERVKNFFTSHNRQYELVCFDENHGIAYARQYALTHATTKYLVFIDADDCPLPQLIEKEYNAINCDQELTAVSSWLQFVDTNCNPMKGGLYMGATTKEAFMTQARAAKRIFMPIQTVFDRECALRVGGFTLDGFPEGKPRYRDFCEDLDLWTRMSDLYTERKYMIVLPEVLYLYRKSDGLSSNHFNMIIKMEYVKANLRRRRAGKQGLTFVEYYNSLSEKQLKKYRVDSFAADALRNGAMLLKRGNPIKGAWLIMRSIAARPSYFFDKLKHNF